MDLNDFANEIAKDWTSNYRARVKGKILIVEYESYDKKNNPIWVEAATMDSNLKITGEDEDAIEQLEYMVSR